MRALWYRFEFRHRQPKQKGQTSCKPNMQFTLDKHLLRSQWWKVYNQYLSSLDCKMEIWSSNIFHLSSSTNDNFCAMATTAPEAMLYSFLRRAASILYPSYFDRRGTAETHKGRGQSFSPSKFVAASISGQHLEMVAEKVVCLETLNSCGRGCHQHQVHQQPLLNHSQDF